MKKYRLLRLICLVVILVGMSSVVVVTARRSVTLPSTNITITNNAQLEIRHLYFAHVGQDDWTGDQLNDSPISSGSSRTLSNVSWDQADIKLIAEDQNGCFLYQTVTCSESASWTIASDAASDCGGN